MEKKTEKTIEGKKFLIQFHIYLFSLHGIFRPSLDLRL